MQNAGLIRRLAAIVYDALLVLAFIIVVTILFNATQGGQNVMTGGKNLVLAYNVVRVLVIYLFFVGYWSTRGRTLGMQSWGLQLLNQHDQVPTLS
ncbi:MAG: RDD family protein, partial [Woeseiaceae bacterium]